MDSLDKLFSISSGNNGDSSVNEPQKVEEVTPEEPETTDTEEKKTEEPEKKAEPESSKDKEAKPSNKFDWDSEENPFRAEADRLKKERETLEKRWKDTHTWGNEEHKKRLAHEARLKEYGEQIQEENPEDAKVAEVEFNAKMKISQELAKNQYGEEYLEQTVYSNDSVWKQILQYDPVYSFRVQKSESPVHEAVKVVNEYNFFTKYGSEPDKIKANIEKELEATLREKITKELHGKLKKKEELPQTLSNVVSTEPEKREPNYHKPLNELFAQK